MKNVKAILNPSLLVIFFLSFAVQSAFTQVIKSDQRLTMIEDVDEEDLIDVQASVESAFVKYRSYASLKGPSGTVDQTGISNFSELFNINASIGNDVALLDYGSKIDVYEYTNLVYQNLPDLGLDYTLVDPYYRTLSYDNAGYFIMEVKVNKVVYNGLDNNLKPSRCNKGRIFGMIMTFEVSEDDFEEVEITSIESELIQDCDDASFSVSVGGRYGIALGDAEAQLNQLHTNTSPLARTSSDLAVNIANLNTISAGVMANFYPFSNQKMSLHIGVNYAQYGFDLDPEGEYETIEKVDKDDTPYQLAVAFGESFIDEYNYTGVEIPVGIGFQYDFSPSFSFTPRLFVIPTLGLSSTSSLTGDVNYSGVYDFGTSGDAGVVTGTTGSVNENNTEFTHSRLEGISSYNYNTYDLQGKETDASTALSIQASLALYFRLSLSDKAQIIVGPDYRLAVTSLYEHEAVNNQILEIDNSPGAFQQINSLEDINTLTSIANGHLSEVKPSTVGLYLALTFQLK